MAKFLFVLSRGLEDPTRVTRALQFAKLAVDEGHETSVFLVDDAVVAAKVGMLDNVKSPTGDDAKSYLDALVAAGTPILVCTPCANARHLDEDEFVVSAKLATGKTLIALAAESTTLSF